MIYQTPRWMVGRLRVASAQTNHLNYRHDISRFQNKLYWLHLLQATYIQLGGVNPIEMLSNKGLGCPLLACIYTWLALPVSHQMHWQHQMEWQNLSWIFVFAVNKCPELFAGNHKSEKSHHIDSAVYVFEVARRTTGRPRLPIHLTAIRSLARKHCLLRSVIHRGVLLSV